MFENFFKKTEEKKISLKKIDLTNEDQIDELLNLSNQETVLLFKHSTRCGISNMVLKRFENKLNKNEEELNYYLLDLLRYRNLSNLIAEKFKIPHQSPQLIVIKDKKVVNHDSHYGILEVPF